MKLRPGRIWLFFGICVGIVVLYFAYVILYFLYFQYPRSPRGDFKLHFETDVSESVSELVSTGFTGLAGSDVVLTFRIPEDDLPRILKKRGFAEVTASVAKGEPTKITLEEWDENQKGASRLGVRGDRFYEITEFDGLVYYIVIADSKTGRVYYRYYKT